MSKSQFVFKECIRCHKTRKFLVGSERSRFEICGECWDWSGDLPKT